MTPSKNIFHILLAFDAHGENFDLAICICHNNPVSYENFDVHGENFDEVLSFSRSHWIVMRTKVPIFSISLSHLSSYPRSKMC